MNSGQNYGILNILRFLNSDFPFIIILIIKTFTIYRLILIRYYRIVIL
jgi:hypothetical protein